MTTPIIVRMIRTWAAFVGRRTDRGEARWPALSWRIGPLTAWSIALVIHGRPVWDEDETGRPFIRYVL